MLEQHYFRTVHVSFDTLVLIELRDSGTKAKYLKGRPATEDDNVIMSLHLMKRRLLLDSTKRLVVPSAVLPLTSSISEKLGDWSTQERCKS